MIVLFCVLYIISFYLSVCYVYIQNIHYFKLLLIKESRLNKISKSKNGCLYLYVTVLPIYREAYFGYNAFVLSSHENKIFFPDEYMKVYGLVKVNSKCLVQVKGDRVKTIIVLKDQSFMESLIKKFREIFRNILIVNLIGGLCLCLTCII